MCTRTNLTKMYVIFSCTFCFTSLKEKKKKYWNNSKKKTINKTDPQEYKAIAIINEYKDRVNINVIFYKDKTQVLFLVNILHQHLTGIFTGAGRQPRKQPPERKMQIPLYFLLMLWQRFIYSCCNLRLWGHAWQKSCKEHQFSSSSHSCSIYPREISAI